MKQKLQNIAEHFEWAYLELIGSRGASGWKYPRRQVAFLAWLMWRHVGAIAREVVR